MLSARQVSVSIEVLSLASDVLLRRCLGVEERAADVVLRELERRRATLAQEAPGGRRGLKPMLRIQLVEDVSQLLRRGDEGFVSTAVPVSRRAPAAVTDAWLPLLGGCMESIMLTHHT